jgi:aspartyl-tRNA(Asn)/glutamyl-tRNA(Gln) amidotransferase subunit A
MIDTIHNLKARLAAGALWSRASVEDCLARASAAGGEGALIFTRLNADRARSVADGLDILRAVGVDLSPICGLPVSVKDLFDVEGEVTTAGSSVLRTRPAATMDAPVMARLKRAGAIIIGRTNMTEFAFSGVGLNPHYARRRMPMTESSAAFRVVRHPARRSV